MNIFELAQRQLARDYANSPKVAALFLVNAAGWFGLDALGFDDLASPWIALTLVPLTLIYFAERVGKLTWFTGMTLPTLLVMAGSVALIWVLNARVPVPTTLAYCVLAGWITTLGFLLFRMWTFELPAQENN